MFLQQSQNQYQKKRSLNELIESGTIFLERHNIDQPRRNAEILLAYILKKPLYYLYVYGNEIISQDFIEIYAGMLKERVVYVPIQYITGESNFFGRTFFVREGVFIPRPETEVLVEKTLSLYRDYFGVLECVRILDIGTGCGNIAVTLASEIENCSVIAIDISPPVLNLAFRNAILHKVEDKVCFEQGDLFPSREEKFHIIVSNPPYIPHSEIPFLDEEVKKEPLRALDGGRNGTRVLERILRRATGFLHHGGFLIMEIGCGQAEFIRDKGIGMNLFSIEKDIAGIERVAVFRNG